MQLASYVHSGINKIGVVSESDLIDLPGLHKYLSSLLGSASRGNFPETMKELIDLDKPWLKIAQELLAAAATSRREELLTAGVLAPIGDCTFRQPVPNPDQIIGVGRNYGKKLVESRHDRAEIPVLFMRTTTSLSASGEAIIRPAVSEMFDFEGEIGVIIGRTARHVSIDDALSVVVGYCPFNDGSIRDWQRSANQVTAGENFYKSGGFGPWITTADVCPPATDINLCTRLNGEVMQTANSADMLFSIAYLISYVTEYTQLEPGDVIATGTPAGVGGRRTPPRWMHGGDEISVELEGLGTLVNVVEEEIEPEGSEYQRWRLPPIYSS